MRMASYAKRVRDIWVHPGNQGQRAAALLRAASWRVQLAFDPKDATIRVFDGLRFRVSDDSMSRSLVYFGPWFEYNEMKFVERYLRPGDAVLDAGANAGIYTLLAATSVGPSGHVDSIEAIASTADRLRQNVATNGLDAIVQIHNVAVGENEGSIAMTDSRGTTNHVVPDGTGTQVECVRLDTLMRGRQYAFAKMDVEGMELPALRGAGEQFSSGNPPVWMIEVNGALFRYGLSVAELVHWVESQGYDLATYNHAERLLRVTKRAWGNVFLIKREAWDCVRQRVPEVRIEHAT